MSARVAGQPATSRLEPAATERVVRRTVLPSGITLLTETMPARRSFAIGVWVNNGARDEPPEWLGISHLLEHMMFKGTERRDARAIAQSLESLGGALDAFTAREQVCYYARALEENLSEVVDVLADIVCRSRFAPDEVEKEKGVVREEIHACEDNPEDKVGELLSEQVWGGHALGRPILGTVTTVDALTPAQLRDYHGRRYRGDHLLVCAVGPVEHEALAELVDRQFTPPRDPGLPFSAEPPPFRPVVRHEERDLQQLYLSLGTRAVPYAHPDHFPLAVLNTLVGGGMSSRLFQAVREEAGLAYSVYSAVDYFRDAGMLSIHMGVQPERGRDALQRTRVELERLHAEGPTADEVEAAQRQIRGAIVMDDESHAPCVTQLAHEEIYLRGHRTLDELIRCVLDVTREQVIEAARRYLAPSGFGLAALGPSPGGRLGEADWPVSGG